MGLLQAIAVAEMRQRGSIKDSDVVRMRRCYDDDARISADEAGELITLNDACPVQDPAWPPLLIEAVTDFVVSQAAPEGYVTTANAQWLVERIAADGRIESKTELELLINVLDKARWSPASLAHFALEHVRQAVLLGDGPARAGVKAEAGTVCAADVALLRRILYAFAGDDGIAISRAEAEVLLDIEEATADRDNDPAWADLFVKAMANAIMAASGYKVPSRETALAEARWLAERGELGIGSIARGELAGILAIYKAQTPEQRALQRLEQQRIEIITSERVTEGEADWLAERIGRDGHLTTNEAALLRFIAAESPAVHPALHALFERARAVA